MKRKEFGSPYSAKAYTRIKIHKPIKYTLNITKGKISHIERPVGIFDEEGA